MSGCVFCKIIERKLPAKIIYEDADWIAILEARPFNKGHTLLIPKKHITSIFELGEAESKNLWNLLIFLKNHLQEKLKTDSVCISVQGFTIPHAHIHLIPVNHDSNVNLQGDFASEEQLEETFNLLK